MRLTAFFKLYKICILLHRCNLKNLVTNRFEKSAIFVKIQQHFCKCCKICKIIICQISKISPWESGRFWKMLQNAYFLAKVGADTTENEQHFAECLPKLGNYPTAHPPYAQRPCPSHHAEVVQRRRDVRVPRVLAVLLVLHLEPLREHGPGPWKNISSEYGYQRGI